MTNPLPKLQQEARKAFWALEEQEPQDYDRFLNDLVARTREQKLQAVEEGIEAMKFDSPMGEEYVYNQAYDEAKEIVAAHLRTLREGITGNEKSL